MDKKLSTALADSIRDLETSGRTMDECLDRHPNQAHELRAHLELWQRLNAFEKAEPAYAGRNRGEQRLLAALRDRERGLGGASAIGARLAPAPVLVAAVAAAVVLLAGGGAGASAALGGPDVAGHVLSTMGINHAPDAAQNGKDHANPNASEGSGNAGQGINNASETGQQNANSNASEGADNHGQGINNASENGNDHANPNASEGATPAGPPDSAPVPDSVPDEAPVPDHIPQGPKP